MTRRSASSAHRGQSLAEFAVLMLALVPLFLAIPLLGKYQDLAHMSESAARYLAFEATAARADGGRRTDAELAQEVRRRFFGNSDAAIKTGDVAGDFATHRNPLWVDHSGRPLLEHVETDVAVHTRSLRSGSQPAALILGTSGFGLPDSELHEGVVTVRPRDIANLPPFDALGLEIRRHQVLLAHGWAAAGADDLADRIAGGRARVYPIAPLKLLGDTVGRLPPLVLDPAMQVGDIKPDVVPCDRLEGGC